MHAVRIHSFGEADVLKVEEVPPPEAKDNEIVVRVMAASVNPVDFKIRSGKYPAVKEDQLPMVLGRDISGVVERVGGNVRKFKKGDAIYAMLGSDIGGYAEFTLVTEDEAAKKPPQLDFVQAAAVPLAALTAWQGLFDHGGLKAGQRVLIHGGAGGVGHFAIQFAKAKGTWVAATVSGEDIALAHKLGADQPIDYKKERFEDVAKDIDLVYDLIAGDTQKRSFAVLKDGGTLISTLQKPDEAELARKHARGAHYLAKPNARELEEIATLIEAGEVRVVVNAIYPLEDAARAHKHIECDHIAGKVVLQVAA
jgi:NADPH:quinone reductase-like Zn-dependent oxidoreductase